MKRSAQAFVFLVIVTLAVIPVVLVTSGINPAWLTPKTMAGLNLLGWSLVLSFWFWRNEIYSSISVTAKDLSIETRFKPFEAILDNVVSELKRKEGVLSLNLMERRINSKEELTRSLERIVAQAYKLLKAESAELALYDKESGLYHSSFVLGKPFRVSSQAMLSGAVEGQKSEESPDVLIQTITFSGAVLGTLRVGLKAGILPSHGDREIARLLALQSGLAILNSEYSTELVRMKRSSEESIKAKTGFLANLSHELRGPLGIMLNAVELVIDGLCGTVTPDQLETLGMVRSNAEHLLELINDVLDYAKVESGKITPTLVDIPVVETLRQVSANVRAQAEAKNHKLTYTPSTDSLHASCDKRHFRQMLINLLTNAIKYTPDGGKIEVWAERMPGSKIKINVKDTGVGIERSQWHKVFAAFERVDNDYSMNQVGTGLGMPLTKRLAEVNGASIDFSSEPGKGSHFWIIFKAVAALDVPISEEVLQEASVRGAGEGVLVIERDAAERNMLARYLSHVGFVPLLAASSAEAKRLIGSSIDLVIIDNNIVDNESEDPLGLIREEPQLSSLPVILISSKAFVFDIEKYLKSGADRCLIKPVSLKDLGITVKALIDDHKKQVSAKGQDKDKKSDEKLKLRAQQDDLMH